MSKYLLCQPFISLSLKTSVFVGYELNVKRKNRPSDEVCTWDTDVKV